MKQTSLKSDRVAQLLDEITERTHETRVEAVTAALERRLDALQRSDRAERALAWLEHAVWSRLPAGARGKAPSDEEQEELLGF